MKDIYNILVVDDVLRNIQLAVNILKQNSNYNIVFATDGESALQRTKEENYDLILLDIMMEPMDGYEVCRQLKNDNSTKNIPIIFLTAKNNEDSIKKGFDLGAVDYITKPFFAAEFLSRVKTHLELKLLRDTLLKEIVLQEKIMFQQNKMATMGEMLENITHQWKQPLSVISAISSGRLIQSELGIALDEKSEKENLQNIMSNVEHLSLTIDDFRDFFKAKDKALFNLNSIISKCINIIDNNIHTNAITISNNALDVEIFGDENLLIQVIINILNNATDALKGKDIKIITIDSITNNDDCIIINIKDSGGGIDKDTIAKVFDTHFTTKEKGTGIGLYMSQRIINEHFNGTLDVKNTKFEIEGQEIEGAEFIISLPISSEN